MAFAPVGAAAEEQDAVEGTRFTEHAGHLSCGANAAGLATDDPCRSVDANALNQFTIDTVARLVALEAELSWTASSNIAPRSLRLQVDPPIDAAKTATAEGKSPVRLVLDPVVAPGRERPMVLTFTILPPQGADPQFIADQSFKVAIAQRFVIPASQDQEAENRPHSEPAVGAVTGSNGEWDELAGSWRVWSGLAVAGAALAWFALPRARRLAMAAFPFFSRLDEDQVLSHPRRSLLVALVRTQPGLAAETVRSRLGLANGSFEHHMRILVQHRVVRRQEIQGRVYLWPSDLRPDVPALESRPLSSRIVELVKKEPGLRQIDLSNRLGAPEKNVRYHTTWLARRGELRLVPEGRAVRCFPG